MKTTIFSLLALASALTVNAQDSWTVDKAHTSVKFTVSHMVISEVDGQFKLYDGSVSSPSADFVGATVNFTVDVASVNTDNEGRDKHLLGDDFFNAEKYPKMTFKSTSFKKVSGNKYTLEGDLTIRDVTKRVTFDVTYGGTVKDPWGNTKAGFKATTVIDRLVYGLKWNALVESGGAVVGKDVTIEVKIELAKEKK